MTETKKRKMSAAQRRERRRKIRNRRIAMTVALVLVVALVSVGGTIAWLTATTAPVTNTFTVGDIDIELIETKKPDGTEVTAGVTNWSAKLVPGSTYSKNPTVTVKANSEKCWLFVKVDEVNNPTNYLTYSYTMDASDSGWTKGTGADGNGVPTNVWYRVVDSSASDTSFGLITNNQVEVKDNVVKSGTSGTNVVPMPSAAPTITFTAYACQYENRTVAQAWAAVNPGA